MARREEQKVIRDPRALRALAHPLRLRLLNHLLAHDSRTASECAAALDDTPSNCSYHLRILARHGYVEREEATDGRERPWRAAATGFSEELPGEAGREARKAMTAVQLDQFAEFVRGYVAVADDLDEKWRDAGIQHNYALLMTAEELAALRTTLDAAIRPFIAPTRDNAPADARVVRLTTFGVLDPSENTP